MYHVLGVLSTFLLKISENKDIYLTNDIVGYISDSDNLL